MARSFFHLEQDDKQYIRDNIDKVSQREMARWIGCHYSTIRYFIKKENIPTKRQNRWTPEKSDEIIALRRLGHTSQEIADIMQVSQGAIRGQLNILRKEGYDVPYLKEWLRIRIENKKQNKI